VFIDPFGRVVDGLLVDHSREGVVYCKAKLQGQIRWGDSLDTLVMRNDQIYLHQFCPLQEQERLI